MTSVSTDSLLKCLGCNMLSAAPKDLFPEEAIAELSGRALKDLKALMLLNAALIEHKELLHPEILLKFLRLENSGDVNVIGALLLKLDDRRFNKVIDFCKSSRKKSALPAKELVLAARIGQSAYDPHFKIFGIEISGLGLPDQKKISSLERLTKTQLIFRNRLLFGCNWRADVISCIHLGYNNPSEIKKRISCSYETAHRIFNDYILFRHSAGDIEI